MTDTAQRAPIRAQSQYPARSKMLDMYAADIAGMFAERHYDEAERHALAIPHIAVALTDAGLQSSRASYADWCAKWVHPRFEPAAYEDGAREVASRNRECRSSRSGCCACSGAREAPAQIVPLEFPPSSGNAQTL